MSDAEEADLILKSSPGGPESVDDQTRDRVLHSPDGQLARARELLQGILLYTARAGGTKVAAQ